MELIIINPPRVIPRQQIAQLVKRAFDISLCLITLPISVPIMSICALAISLESTGPVFFVQERIGKGGRPFRMYKFRTMKPDSDDWKSRNFMKAYVKGQIGCDGGVLQVYKPIQREEMTRLGCFLRRTSLDELPQLINVINGEMSIVGPRPNVEWEVEEYLPWHYERLEVLPGITGLAQVRGRSCLDFNSIVRYDIKYIENKSLLMDLKILWWTLIAVILGKGAD